MTKAQKAEQAEAIERLREWIKPGSEVYCILRHVSKSGMSRVIDLKVIDCNGPNEGGDVLNIGYNAALALGWPFDRAREGIKVQGCGMDMGFHTVYSLAHTLFPVKPGDTEQSGPDAKSGGYALKSRWL